MSLALVPRGHLLGALVVAFSLVCFRPVEAQPVFATNFGQVTAFSGMTNPTVIRFASDGRIFIAEKSGRIHIYDNASDPTPTTLTLLVNNVMNYWDRGLLGLALHPNFPTTPYIYVLYVYDAPPGQAAPFWNDACADPTGQGCPVTGRLSRIEISPTNTVVGSETPILSEEWCQQYPSHSIGTIAFGRDGALYLSAGDGASFTYTDWGQSPHPTYPCVDPANEGGALRSQDVLTSGDPFGYDGTILRIDPDTGAALSDNPLYGGSTGDDRIIAAGLRNPFRFGFRPGTDEVWIGDVGWNAWEEVNRLVDPQTFQNFGWPCYEGNTQTGGYSSRQFCIDMYAGNYGALGTHSAPYFAYPHNQDSGSNRCVLGAVASDSSVAGITFYEGGDYPNSYDDALFFSDYSRKCIWAMQTDNTGLPAVANV
ncbi:MAG: PQQ-dependent sugar dehydrogenase, partial [Myxococcales bacterium]|nr:PQQ-dependent sugar dehydrogenase [Myxococcales bacterium]